MNHAPECFLLYVSECYGPAPCSKHQQKIDESEYGMDWHEFASRYPEDAIADGKAIYLNWDSPQRQQAIRNFRERCVTTMLTMANHISLMSEWSRSSLQLAY